MLPALVPFRQAFPAPAVADLAGAIDQALFALQLKERVKPGMRIGIPVGSRGITQIDLLLRRTVSHVRQLGAEPVVVAAMGSHGGGSSSGQRAVLAGLGITAEGVGAPILAGTEVAVLGTDAVGEPVYFDRILAGCDGLLVVNRVKPHTSFHGPLESGLTKMLVVGCGKAEGARQFHARPPARLSERLVQVGTFLLGRLPILGGLGVLENGYGEVADLVAVQPSGWIEQEQGLLERARALQPRLPVDHLHLLIVDEMGKEIAGTGMDTNVIGRTGIRGVEASGPQIDRIVVLDLSAGSHGNANGMGLADLTTQRLASKVDFAITYLNTLTATFVERAKLPIVLKSDREAIEAALRTIGTPSEPRIIRIKNTLTLERFLVSPALLPQLTGDQVDGEPIPWAFDEAGNLHM